MRRLLMMLVGLVVCGMGTAQAQTPIIPPGTGQVVYCIAQADPPPTSWRLVLNGAAPIAVTMDATIHADCQAGSTHSFRRPGSDYALGNYVAVVQSVSQGGQVTDGPEFQFVVDIVPGPATITGVRSVPGA